jgi:hypothetical protein
MIKKYFFSFVIIVFSIFFIGSDAYAGFGISPPYVKTSKPIFPGSHYEQKITLLRSSAEDGLRAEVTINAPDFAQWITIDKGLSFDLPAGELQVPMIVRVDVPKEAELGEFKGNINVRIAPKDTAGNGGVSIALGARIEIYLVVDNESFVDYIIRSISIPDFEELKTPWRWPLFSYFFNKIEVAIKIENTGNIKAAPTKVKLDIYDIGEKTLLETKEDKSIKKVDPFATADVIASYRTRLTAGQYWGKVKVYKENEIIKSDKIAFTIYPPGKSPTGTRPLGPWPYVMMAGIIILILSVLYFLIKIRSWRALIKLLQIMLIPLIMIWRGFVNLKKKATIRFWRWMHRKSSQYQVHDLDNQDKADKK